MEKLITNYLELWNNKDLIGLSKLFHKDIRLVDWENQAVGLEEVLNLNANIFSNYPNIKAKPTNIAHNDISVFLRLEIQIEKNQLINVVDIITLENRKIIEILAYRQ